MAIKDLGPSGRTIPELKVECKKCCKNYQYDINDIRTKPGIFVGYIQFNDTSYIICPTCKNDIVVKSQQ